MSKTRPFFHLREHMNGELLQKLRDKANHLPLLPGVYLMLDKSGEVIYVGKAK